MWNVAQFKFQRRAALCKRVRCPLALLLLPRQTARIAGLFPRQPDFSDQFARARRRVLFRFTFYNDRSFNNVLQHRTVREEIKDLENEADMLAQAAN